MSIYLTIEVEKEEQVDQGDIFIDIFSTTTKERVNAIVVTPACDLKQGKADYIKLIATTPYKDVVLDLLKDHSRVDEADFGSQNVISRTKYNSAFKTFLSNINGDLSPRYYLIPSHPYYFTESYLDFQHVFTIPTEEVYIKYMRNRVAKVISPWREQIIARYNGYSVRVGTPDFTEQDIRGLLEVAGLTLPPIE